MVYGTGRVTVSLCKKKSGGSRWWTYEVTYYKGEPIVIERVEGAPMIIKLNGRMGKEILRYAEPHAKLLT